MNLTPAAQRVLHVTTGVVLVAGLLAAGIVGGGDGGDGGTDVATDPSTSVPASGGWVGAAPDGGDAGGAGGGDGGQPAGSAPTTSVAPAGSPSTAPTRAAGGGRAAPESTSTSTAVAPAPAFEDLGPAGDGGEVKVPRSGTYAYHVQDGEGNASEGTTRVEDRGAGPGGGRLLLMSIRGQGFDSDNDVTWGPSDVKVTESRLTFGGRSATCNWEPDYVETVLPLKKGASWSSTSTCTVSGFTPAPITIKRTTTNTVTDARRVRVGGEETNVWVIAGTEKVEFGTQANEATSTTWFSGAHGTVVRTEAKSGDGSGTMQLRSLTPAP